MNEEVKQDLKDQIAHGLFEPEQDELDLADFSDEFYDDDEDYDLFDQFGGDGYGI